MPDLLVSAFRGLTTSQEHSHHRCASEMGSRCQKGVKNAVGGGNGEHFDVICFEKRKDLKQLTFFGTNDEISRNLTTSTV